MFDDLEKALSSRNRRVLTRPKQAAVLVPVVDDGGPMRVLLTRRTNRVGTHQGQVAFPGGRRDAGDESLVHTALREAEEEIGLASSYIDVLGCLDDFPTIHNDTVVTPVVARIASLPQLTPSPIEVARIFDIPVAHLVTEEAWRVESMSHRGTDWPVYFCDHDGETLWGLSAYITLHMLSLSTLGAPFELKWNNT